MFVQTHFQRKSHQAALAQATPQNSSICKSQKCSSNSCRSNKKVAQSRSSTIKSDAATTKAMSFEQNIRAKKQNLTRGTPTKASIQTRASTSDYLNSNLSSTVCKKQIPRFGTKDQNAEEDCKYCACQSFDLDSTNKCKELINCDQFESPSKQNLSAYSNLRHGPSLSKKSPPNIMCSDYLSIPERTYDSTSNTTLESSTDLRQKSSSIFDNFTESLVLVGRSLTSRIFNNETSTKHHAMQGEPQIILKRIRTHLELVVSFSVNLISYQLETWRLLFDNDKYVIAYEQDVIVKKSKILSEFDIELQNSCSKSHNPTSKKNEINLSLLTKTYSDQNRSNGSLIHHTSDAQNLYSRRAKSLVIGHSLKLDQPDGTSLSCLNQLKDDITNDQFNLDSHSYQIPFVRGSDESFALNQIDVSKLNIASIAETSIPPNYEAPKQQNTLIETIREVNLNGFESEILAQNNLADGTKSSRKLSLTGTKGRIWFTEKKSGPVDFRRSDEIFPVSKVTTSTNSSADNGALAQIDLNSMNNLTSATSGITPDRKTRFVEGLGIGQFVSHHALVSSVAGEIQLYLTDTRGILEMAVIQARALHIQDATKDLPSTYAKLYLIRNKKCIAKYKTRTIPETVDPLYHQKFIYRVGHTNCIVQVIIWNESSKKSKKSLVGAAQIRLSELNMSQPIVSWYKLFDMPSMTGPFLSSKSLRRRLLSISMASPSI